MMVEERVLGTGRLRIRNFHRSDVGPCWESWGQDESLGQYIASYPMTDLGQMEELVRGFLSNEDAWVIEDKGSEKIVGYITMDIPYRQLGVGEIGYVIGEKYQKHGYAFEAIHCILAEYLINRGLYMIEAKCNETNHASLKLLEKVGFHVDGRLRGRRMNLLTGERTDLIVASVTQAEFRSCTVEKRPKEIELLKQKKMILRYAVFRITLGCIYFVFKSVSYTVNCKEIKNNYIIYRKDKK